MVYDAEVAERVYPTVLTNEDLLNIRANEVLRLADGDAPYARLWKKYVEDLSPQEKEAVYDFLKKEKTKFKSAKGDLMQRIKKDDIARSGTINEEIRWYDAEIARRESGMQYLRKLPDFPL